MDISTGDGAPQNTPVNFGVDPGGGWDDASPANAEQQDVEPDWGVKPGNDPAHEWDDSSPASAAPSGMASAGAEISSVAAQPPAPLTDLEIGHAALICGYSAQKSANPISDAELAQHFGTSPNVIAARRDDFLRRYVIVTARDALSTSPVLCRAIRNNPSIGSQVQPDVPLLARLENALGGGWRYFQNVVARNTPKDMSVTGATQAFGGTTLDLLKDAHDAVTSTVRNELTGIARGAMHVGAALGDAPMMAFDKAAGGNSAEKLWIGSALQAEKWMFGNTDDSTSAVRHLAYAATQGLGGGTNDLMRAASVLSSVPAVMMDKTAGLFTGGDYDKAEKWWYSNTTDKLEDSRPSYELAPDSGLAEKAAHGLGSLAALLPYMYLTGGAGGTAEAATGIFARLASGASRGAKAMPIPAIAAYVNTGNDVFEKTGDPVAAQKAAVMSGFTTLLNGMVPLAIPGKMATRVFSGMPVGMGVGEASRLLNNLALPETMQHEFDRDNLLVNGILGSAMAGFGPHGPDTAPEPQLHAGLAKAIEAFDAAQYYKYLASISETGKGVSLGKSNPGLLRNILLEMGDKTGNRALTVRAGDFAQAMEDSGVTPEAFQAGLPEVYAQLRSLPPDGSLQIPHATLAQHPELLEPVLSQARIAPGAPSGAEALAQANEHFDNLAQKIKAAADRQAEGEAGRTGANEVPVQEVETEKDGPRVLGQQEPIPADKFTAADYAKSHDKADVSTDEILSYFPPGTKEKIARVQERLANIEQTIDTFKHDGKWDDQREILHHRIIRDILSPERVKAAIPAHGEKPKFIILGGRGGSGKSAFAKPESEGGIGVVDDGKFIVLDADHIKGLLPEYEGWNAHQLHEESGELFELISDRAQKLGLNVCHDATMKSGKKAVELVKQFNDAGYQTEAHYMHLPRQEAAKRAVDRFLNGGEKGRYVPVEVVLSNTSNESSFDQVKNMVGRWSFRDNNVPEGKPPILISEGGKRHE